MHKYPPNKQRKHVRGVQIEGDYVFIPLTRGMVAKADAEDAELLSRYTWYAKPSRKGVHYAVTCVSINGRFVAVPMHRLLMNVDDPKQQIDHLDRDGLNNTKSNLRIANATIQKLNQSVRVDNSSGVAGVHMRPNGYWQARVSVYGKRYSLGHFNTLEHAVEVRNAVMEILNTVISSEFKPGVRL